MKIPKINDNKHGGSSVAGFYAVSPSGSLIVVAPTFKLESGPRSDDRPSLVRKVGWRWATQKDIDAAAAKAATHT